MELDRIVTGLSSGPRGISRPDTLARMAFLEWLMSLPGGTDASRAAGAALEELEGVASASPALSSFVELLQQAAATGAVPPGPARRRRLH